MTDSLQAIVDRIAELPAAWHGAGSLGIDVLRALAEHLAGLAPACSLETGAGKSTLLLSHASQEHWVFALDHAGSLSTTLASPLLRRDAVRVVEGPTQTTLQQAPLPPQIQFALLDGPHAYPFPELEYFAIYPRLTAGALLVIDDLHIPTVRRLYDFLVEDAMFAPLPTVCTTGILRRTDAPTFDPLMDGWEHQRFNQRRFPIRSSLLLRARQRALQLLRRWRRR